MAWTVISTVPTPSRPWYFRPWLSWPRKSTCRAVTDTRGRLSARTMVAVSRSVSGTGTGNGAAAGSRNQRPTSVAGLADPVCSQVSASVAAASATWRTTSLCSNRKAIACPCREER